MPPATPLRAPAGVPCAPFAIYRGAVALGARGPPAPPGPAAGRGPPRAAAFDAGASASYSSDSSGEWDDPAGGYAPPPPVDPRAFTLENGLVDYYELLGVPDDAAFPEIKAAYRALTKVCHPDVAGEEAGTNMCILVNEAYEVLRDPEARRAYNAALDEALEDSSDGFDGAPLSKWCANTRMGRNADPSESRAAFVDELTCIGCKQCVWEAPGTFRIEAEHGRSRVFAQWVDTEDSVTAAIEACPVSCIHWVEKEDLPALEFVTRYKVPRVGVGLMMAGQGGAVGDVWDYTARYLKEREAKRAARARAARYSAAQAAARAAAAAAVAARQGGWFEAAVAAAAVRVGLGGDLGARVQDAMRSSMGEETSEDEFAAYARVGQRRRAARRAPGYGARGANGGRVPEERALVPAAEARPRWDRR